MINPLFNPVFTAKSICRNELNRHDYPDMFCQWLSSRTEAQEVRLGNGACFRASKITRIKHCNLSTSWPELFTVVAGKTTVVEGYD